MAIRISRWWLKARKPLSLHQFSSSIRVNGYGCHGSAAGRGGLSAPRMVHETWPPQAFGICPRRCPEVLGSLHCEEKRGRRQPKIGEVRGEEQEPQVNWAAVPQVLGPSDPRKWFCQTEHGPEPSQDCSLTVCFGIFFMEAVGNSHVEKPSKAC